MINIGNLWRKAELITIYACQIDLSLGFIQFAQVSELACKMQCILQQKQLSQLEKNSRLLYFCLGIGLFFSLGVLPYFNVVSYKFYNDNTNFTEAAIKPSYQAERIATYKSLISQFGYISGSEYFLLLVLFTVALYNLNKILHKSDYLNIQLKSQRSEHCKFWYIVAFTYGVRTIVQFLFGHYRSFIKYYFWRWNLYFISNPILDTPTILYVFILHYKTFG